MQIFFWVLKWLFAIVFDVLSQFPPKLIYWTNVVGQHDWFKAGYVVFSNFPGNSRESLNSRENSRFPGIQKSGKIDTTTWYNGGVHLPQKSTSMKCPSLLLFIVGSHFYVAPVFKFILKSIFLHQIKAKGHDKGHQILKEGPPGAVWIFSEFEYRYLVELKS